MIVKLMLGEQVVKYLDLDTIPHAGSIINVNDKRKYKVLREPEYFIGEVNNHVKLYVQTTTE